ncbi:DUF6049 family protein [Streptomyces sp. NBRC 110028]|uniref:DUF6049 family protein n=1 Tax=Streptomyces sp. NBRC 110028 TaxID=1621260 RepID=UPI00099E4207|nr:DUF6049 family protein [Streptomyces sp. NBRC 110028]
MADAADLRETTSSRARRWLRRTGALLAAAPVLAGVLQAPGAPAAHAAGKPTGSRSVDVDITSLTPTAPAKSDTLTVSGTVTNDSGSTVSGAHVGLRVGPTMEGRNAIDSVSRRTGYQQGADGTEIGGKYAEKIGKLGAGVSRDFTLSIPVNELHLGENGVYQLGVSLSGQTRSRPWQQVLGIKRTFLPWQSSAPAKKSQLTYLWPLISTPHMTSRTDADEDRTPIFRDDRLKAELAPGGRLQQMVSLGKNLPITWVIDPDLLATVDAMTREYEVQNRHGDGTTAGSGQAVAKRWLNDLQKAVQGHQVVALPFSDPDLASLAHHGKNVPGALSHLRDATELASTTVETVLGVKPRTDFAWPADGAVDSSIVDVATSAGAHNVIARSDSLRETGSLSYTPTAARQIGGGNTAVVADARLSTAFTGDMSKADNSTLAIQRFLAQSQMINLQSPDRQRSIVVAPQRIPTTSQAQAMAAALDGLSGQWTQPMNLGQAVKAKPDPNATQRVPSTRAYPASLRRQELPTQAFEDVRKTQGTLDRFVTILTAKYHVVSPFGNAIRREMSTSWRGDARGATHFREGVQGYLEGLTKKVRLIPKTDMTLSGRSATIPVTVQNNLVQGVQLRLILRSQQGNRLAVSEPQVVNVEGGHSQSVKFGTTANANGPVWVSARLVTPDGQPYSGEMAFEVNVTEITSTVILVIAGGVLLLVLAGIRIYLQRKRTATADGGDEDAQENEVKDAETDGDDPASALVPEQPSDPAPDTGSQSAGASGAGEKVDH